MSTPKVFIYGSCVSRDPVDLLLRGQEPLIELAGYKSKTSIFVQGQADVVASLATPSETDFASRMIAHDFRRDVLASIEESDAKFLVLDFIDERLPIVEVDGAYLTASRFFVQRFSKYERQRRTIDIYSDHGFSVYEPVFRGFMRRLGRLAASRKVVLHRAWWARSVRDESGTKLFPPARLEEAHRNNIFLGRLYKIVKEEIPDVISIELPRSLIVADAHHKWGCDPFHYVDDYSLEFNSALLKVVSRNTDGQHAVAPVAEAPEGEGAALRRAGNPIREPSGDLIGVNSGPPIKPTHARLNAAFPENRRLVPAVSFYADDSPVRDPIVKHFGLSIPYLTHEREYVAKFRDTGVVFDQDGVPFNNFRWGGPHRYSVTIGHHGLSCLARYLVKRDVSELMSAVSVADWLVQNQSDSGAWLVDFEHDWFPPRCAPISAPWVSAMGQGLCISLLTRLANTLRNEGDVPSQCSSETLDVDRFLDAATNAVSPFFVSSGEGGVLAIFGGAHQFYEEYPTKPASFVLNGFVYSLLGLYDLAQLGDKRAAERYGTGIESLASMLPHYDLGRGTAYDLTHISAYGYPPNIARKSYHFIHVQLLSVLNLLEGGRFEVFLQRWLKYLEGYGERTN